MDADIGNIHNIQLPSSDHAAYAVPAKASGLVAATRAHKNGEDGPLSPSRHPAAHRAMGRIASHPTAATTTKLVVN